MNMLLWGMVQERWAVQGSELATAVETEASRPAWGTATVSVEVVGTASPAKLSLQASPYTSPTKVTDAPQATHHSPTAPKHPTTKPAGEEAR
jgi:hypothetical protein